MTSETGQGSWPPPDPETLGPLGGEGIFPLPLPEVLRRAEWGTLTSRQRKAGLRDLQGAMRSLNSMHGCRGRPRTMVRTTAT